jgi:alpha-1,2-mannosyltransferase
LKIARVPDIRPAMSTVTATVPSTTIDTFRHWVPAVVSAAGALGLSLYLAFHNYQVDIDVYRMGGRHVLSADLYSVQFGKSGMFFTYTPFAAIVFALFGLNLSIWSLQLVWAVTNVVALAALIYLSIRIVVPRLLRTQVVRLALLFLLPALALNPVFNTIGLGQINLVLCLLITWDLATDRRIGSRTLPLGVAIGIAAAIKLTPLIFVPYLVVTRRARGALCAVITFTACQAIGFLITPRNSWTYWTKDVLDSKRAGALLYTSDQNLSSVLERFHHGPVSGFVLIPTLVVIGAGGLALAAWAHRRSSVMLGALVCATTGLIISPITWVHHMVWVVPAIIWLAAGADRPRRGPLLAGFAVVLFVAAPIWWVPRSWKVTTPAPELHQNHWQLFVGNSFFFAMLAFLGGVAVTLVRRRSAHETSERGRVAGGARLSRLHLAVENRTGWFVGADDDAEIGRGEADGAHRRREGAGVEQAATRTQHQGIRHQAEAVDELVLQEGLEQVAASPDLQLVARSVLQRLQRRHDVAGDQVSRIGVLAPPYGVGLAERAGHDVLGRRVDRRGNGVGGVGLIGPEAAKDFERSPTEQERAGVAVELADERADGRVGERRLPAAVGETVAGIFLGSPGGLHHAIEGQECLHGELHVDGDGAARWI